MSVRNTIEHYMNFKSQIEILESVSKINGDALKVCLLNKESNRRKRKNKDNPKGFCPFVQDPHSDCYCFDMGSQNKIKSAIYYCQEKYEKCELYQRLLKDADTWRKLT